jgi:hypothetical protein
MFPPFVVHLTAVTDTRRTSSIISNGTSFPSLRRLHFSNYILFIANIRYTPGSLGYHTAQWSPRYQTPVIAGHFGLTDDARVVAWSAILMSWGYLFILSVYLSPCRSASHYPPIFLSILALVSCLLCYPLCILSSKRVLFVDRLISEILFSGH